MSMTGNIKQISPLLLTELLNDTSLTTAVLNPELYSHSATTGEIRLIVSSDENTPKLELGPDFYAIQYLLTGSLEEISNEDPLALAIFGKTPLGEVSDYGPLAQYLTLSEVKETAEVLRNTSEEALKARYNPQSLAGEYFPFSKAETDQVSQLEELLAIYREIVAYYKLAAEKGNAMLFWIS